MLREDLICIPVDPMLRFEYGKQITNRNEKAGGEPSGMGDQLRRVEKRSRTCQMHGRLGRNSYHSYHDTQAEGMVMKDSNGQIWNVGNRVGYRTTNFNGERNEFASGTIVAFKSTDIVTVKSNDKFFSANLLHLQRLADWKNTS